ncbi:MAG: hypothetical protein AB7U98_00240 [Candidatus Nitrosocosmicus sp.]
MSNINFSELIVSKKGVILSDRQPAGNIIGERGDSIIVEKGVANEHIYLIPKSKIEAYDGAQLKLKVAYQDLSSFEEKRENKGKDESMLDNISEKLEDAKEKVEDKTKEIAQKSKHTIDSTIQSSTSNSSEQDREYEEGVAGTNKERKSDPLTQYSDKEPMTPAKINEGEPTAVKRDPNDQQITSEGQTGTDTLKAQEEYRKRGMTKVDSHEHHSHEGSSCSCGH